MKKIKYIVAFIVVIAVVFIFTSISGSGDYSSENRAPAQIPEHYEESTACQKQDILWERIQSTTHRNLPPFESFGLPELVKIGIQHINTKGENHSDFAPPKWRKYLHARGSIAKIKIVPVISKYTGIFAGADCGLLRLSLTYKTGPTGPTRKDMPVAPGLALKVLRDQVNSANISALVSLEGQEKEFNFFKRPMSNIVPIGEDWGQKRVHNIFRKVSDRPEELLTDHFAAVDQRGAKVNEPISPKQLFFVAGETLSFPSEEHDVRTDFAKIPSGTTVYKILAANEEDVKSFNYDNYTHDTAKKFLASAVHIADIVTTSEFISSEFGDSGIFFRHQLYPKYEKTQKLGK